MSELYCYVCLEDENLEPDVTIPEKWVKVSCNCHSRTRLNYIHRDCLLKTIIAQKNTECKVCHTNYRSTVEITSFDTTPKLNVKCERSILSCIWMFVKIIFLTNLLIGQLFHFSLTIYYLTLLSINLILLLREFKLIFYNFNIYILLLLHGAVLNQMIKIEKFKVKFESILIMYSFYNTTPTVRYIFPLLGITNIPQFVNDYDKRLFNDKMYPFISFICSYLILGFTYWIVTYLNIEANIVELQPNIDQFIDNFCVPSMPNRSEETCQSN